MNSVDLLFPVVGSRLPTDHRYPLFAAVTRILPWLREGSIPFALAPVSGQPIGDGLLSLNNRFSRLRLRIPASDIPKVLPLSGKRLQVMGRWIQLGAPQLYALVPGPSLFARTVTFKKALEPNSFLDTARKHLNLLGVGGKVSIPKHRTKAGEIEPHRQVIRIKDACIVGFSLLVEELQPQESLLLMEKGLGGRRHMGGGVFVPAENRESDHEA